MRKVLVTGGAGFIGSHLCEKLLQDGWQVVSLDNFNDFYDPSFKRANIREVEKTATSFGEERFQSCEGDIRDEEFLENLFSQQTFTAVVHLAAYAGVRPSILNPVLYYDVNVTGTLKLLETMRAHEVKTLVFAASSSVYGNNEKVPFSESDPVDHPISPYAATKKAGELMCHAWHHLHGFSVACLRFFTVYGPRQRPDLAIRKFTAMVDQCETLPVFGDGTTERDYTFITDILDGVEKALGWALEGTNRYEIFNLGESKTVTLNRMIAGIEEAMGKKATRRQMPEQPGDVKRTFADIAKARRILGYAPVTGYEEGIKAFVDWYCGKAKM